MKATEAVKSWKELSTFIYERVSGVDKSPLREEDYELLEKEGGKIISERGVDEVVAKAKKIANLNILDKNVDFKFFENVPTIWSAYFNAANYYVSSGSTEDEE